MSTRCIRPFEIAPSPASSRAALRFETRAARAYSNSSRLRVEIPAVIIKLAIDGFDLIQGLMLEVLKPDDHIRDLDSRIVDVVLNLDGLTGRAEHSDGRISKHGIAHVPDVGGLIRIDRSVLDNDFPAQLRRHG